MTYKPITAGRIPKFDDAANGYQYVDSKLEETITGAFVATISGTISANRIYTLPNVAGTFALLEAAQTWPGVQTIPALIASKIYPASDSTTAIQLLKADGTTVVLNLDTTNRRVSIGTTTNTHRFNIGNGHLNFVSVVRPSAPAPVLAGVGPGLVENGLHNYKLTYVTAFGETNTSLGAGVTVTNKTTDGKVKIPVVASADPAVTNIRIYRTKAADANDYRLQSTVANTNADIIDDTPDAGLGTVRSESRDNTTAGNIYLDGSQVLYLINNVFVGPRVATSFTTSTLCVGIGVAAAELLTTASYVTAVGALAYQNGNGSFVVALGSYAGNENTAGTLNLYAGHAAGQKHTGSRSIFIGPNAGATLTAVNDRLIIDVSNTLLPLLDGDFSGTKSLTINGNLNATKTDTATNTVVEVLATDHETTNTPDVGYGSRFSQYLEDSTTARVLAASEDTLWATAAHAGYAGRKIFYIYDFTAGGTARECMRIESSGTAAMIGFLGASAIVRPSSTTDLRAALINLGLYTTGGATPLDLNGGTLTALNAVVTNQVQGPKAGITEEGGVYIVITAGENLTRGEVVQITQGAGGANDKAYKNAIDSDMPVGVVFATATANNPVKIVVSGIAYVLPDTGITAARGYVIYSSGTTAGLVAQNNTIPAAATHFRECGHFLDTGSGNGAITRAIIHFN